jgi:hypothetical protein
MPNSGAKRLIGETYGNVMEMLVAKFDGLSVDQSTAVGPGPNPVAADCG